MNKGDILAKRYKVVKLIGQGGMADVYLAYDVLLERDVAIKILRHELSSDAVSLLRFKHEAVAVSKLSHPNIIEIFDIGEHDSRQYIVMEYVDGKTLKQLINARGGLYKEEAVYIMKQLTSAVSEAHNNEIIHRDIKPQNVLLKSDGSVIITDFGIALAENALHLTQKETVMGSVHYLAPELARGEKATYQSDIYALGIVFYELLAGGVPFSGDTAIQIAMQHINKPIPSIKDFNPTISQAIENVIIKSTFKNKQQRYKSALEMLDDLDTVFNDDRKDETKLETDVIVTPEDKTKVISELQSVKETNAPVNKKKRTRNIIIGSVIAVLLLFGMVWASNRPVQKEEVTVPDIVGLDLEEAREKLLASGLSIGLIERDLDDEFDVNIIIRQTPRQNSLVDKASEVNIVISKGKYFVFEDYVGKDYDSVRVELENSFRNISIRAEYISNSEFREGQIYSQDTEVGKKLDPNNAYDVKFVVVKATEITIPNTIYGMNIYEAKKMLEDLGAKVTLKPITGKSAEFLATKEKNIVEWTIPTINSRYVQTASNSIIIEYYEESDEPIEKPKDPEPDDSKDDPAEPGEPGPDEPPVEDPEPEVPADPAGGGD